MSSSSSSHPNPNPNFNSIKPSPSTQLPKFKYINRKSRNKNKFPNWLDLPEDIWSLIFSKLDTISIIENVQKVCMLFRMICKQPSLYKVVDMTLPDDILGLFYDVNIMTRHIVDRSCGGLIDIYLDCACDDYTLMYIAERSKNLKHLRLGFDLDVSREALINAVKMLPTLEEVEIIASSFKIASKDTIEGIGHACPSLKSFSWNDVGFKCYEHPILELINRRRKRMGLRKSTQNYALQPLTFLGRSHFGLGKISTQFYGEVPADLFNVIALEIAKSMPNLRKLQLIGNLINNEGLKAVLDGCPHLESLDLRACFGVDLSGDLGERCGKIKHLRLPNDSTADYSRFTDFDDDDISYGIDPDFVQHLFSNK